MKKECKCGFCEKELMEDSRENTFCQPCEVAFVTCLKCGASYNKALALCPDCKTEQEKS